MLGISNKINCKNIVWTEILQGRETVKYLNVVSAIPGIFAECTAMRYRVCKIINLMKGGSRKKRPEKIQCHCQVLLRFSDMPCPLDRSRQ